MVLRTLHNKNIKQGSQARINFLEAGRFFGVGSKLANFKFSQDKFHVNTLINSKVVRVHYKLSYLHIN